MKLTNFMISVRYAKILWVQLHSGQFSASWYFGSSTLGMSFRVGCRWTLPGGWCLLSGRLPVPDPFEGARVANLKGAWSSHQACRRLLYPFGVSWAVVCRSTCADSNSPLVACTRLLCFISCMPKPWEMPESTRLIQVWQCL